MKTIVTFYSYKGGVGRTMAMSNIAVLLARRGMKVLAVDWDLEAPGLERYFGYFTVKPSKGGLLPLLKSQQRGSRPHYRSHLSHVSGTGFELDLLLSGREIDPSYSATLERFDWDRYFEGGGGDFIEDLRTQWRKSYDVTLIDSRTGLSDTGGICTIQLPDVVVAMFTANYQSLYGVRDTMRLAQSARDALAYDRMHLRVLPVAARFSRDGGTPEAKIWTDRIGEALAEFYSDWLPSWAQPQQAAERLRIPQVDAFGFGEKLAIVEESSASNGSMIPIYERIADLLTQSPPDAENVLELARPDVTIPLPAGAVSVRAPEPSPLVGYEHDIFVSHAAGTVLDEWVDVFLEQLRRKLQVVLGREPRIFFDLSQVRVDAAWDASVANSLQRSRLLLAIVTPKFMESPWCRAQWATFERREKEIDGPTQLIVSLLVQATENLPEWIARRQLIDLTRLPRRVAALFEGEQQTEARVLQVADAIDRALRNTPTFNPAWSVDTPDTIESKRPPVVDAGPSPLTLDAEAITALLERGANPEALAAGRTLMKQLLLDGDFAQLAKLAGAVHRRMPSDIEATLNLALGLYKTGHAGEAEKLLARLVKSLHRSNPLYGEATYLLGDAYIEQFVSASPRTSRAGRSALSRGIQTYRLGFEANREQNVWHGVRLVALLAAAQRYHIPTPAALKLRTTARSVLNRLERIPTSLRTEGYHAGVAQLYIGRGNWPLVEEHFRAYLATPDLSADDLKLVLRDLTELWDIEHDLRGAPIVAALRTRVLRTAGGSVEIPTAVGSAPPATDVSPVLEARFGGVDTQTVHWMRTSLERVRSVGAVGDADSRVYGTCFLVEARALGLALNELVAITAAHVIGDHEHGALRPSQAEITFEAMNPHVRSAVANVLWTSPSSRLDTTVLQLRTRPTGLAGLPISDRLPSLDEPTRVYLAGHPGGRQLSISLQDNELLDHEGPPFGTPRTPGVVRLHYRAPTEAGSSGSPVFNERWEVIGVHHRADEALSRLNGKPGTYRGSEAIWIQSIVAMIKAITFK